MTVTEVKNGRVLAYITQQELELVQGCIFEALHSLESSALTDLIGYDREEAKALMRQVSEAIEMVKRGGEPGAFGQLQPKR